MERPLELCEVLEEEHLSLYGRNWLVTAADIIDPVHIAEICRKAFPAIAWERLATTDEKLLRSDRAGVAKDLSKVVDGDERLDPDKHAVGDETAEAAKRAATSAEANRRILDCILKGWLRRAQNFGWRYDRDQIRDARGLAVAFAEAMEYPTALETLKLEPDDVRETFANALNERLVTDIQDWKRFDGRISATTRRLLDNARGQSLMPSDIEYLNRKALDDLFGDYVVSGSEARLSKYYEVVHLEAQTSALCFSGGGIRSATFGLGLLQGLSRRNVLGKVDFVSTVSGGGYIGSWLSSWIRRHPESVRGVSDEMASIPDHPLQPDPAPVRHLREYSNYLTPRLGLMSGDTWTLIATYVRNLLLNWTILLPLLVAALALPRVVAAIYFQPTTSREDAIILWGGLAFLAYGLLYLGWMRPTDNRYRERGRGGSDASFRTRFVLPVTFGAVLLTAAWVTWASGQPEATWKTLPKQFVWVMLGGPLVVWAIHSIKYVRADAAERRESVVQKIRSSHPTLRKIVGELVASLVAGSLSLALTEALALGVFAAPNATSIVSAAGGNDAGFVKAALYLCLAVPMFMASFYVSAAVFVGVSSLVNEDYDREWWARSSGWVLFMICAWTVVFGIVVFGPMLILAAPKIVAAVGGVSGIAAVALGRSSKTSAKHEKTTGTDYVARLIAPCVIVLICAGVSLLTDWIIASCQSGYASFVPLTNEWTKTTILFFNHLNVIYSTNVLWAYALLVIPVLIASAASYVINVNKFSMHAMYRNRLIRAYLGASRTTRDPNPFTGFDPNDNLSCDSLRPELLWASSFKDFDSFVEALRNPREKKADGTPAMDRALARAMERTLGYDVLSKDLSREALVAAVFQVLNCILKDEDLTRLTVPQQLASRPRKSAWRIFADALAGHELDADRLRRNRRILEAEYPAQIYPFDAPLLSAADIVSAEALREALGTEHGKLLVAKFHDPTLPDRLHITDSLVRSAVEATVSELNYLMTTISLIDMKPLDQPPSYAQVGANRTFLRHALASRAVGPQDGSRPLQVVNAALNLVAATNLAWQERKAESFTFSPLHAGSAALGYRPVGDYGGTAGISLGTAMTISGAAASPNMGYNSSAPLAFLLTLFNVRLGWWLGNPGPHGGGVLATYTQDSPRIALRPLIAEMTGNTNDTFPYVYLSDGGHFENLGLYEMVMRRRRFIIVSDAGCDPDFKFDDLGNAIRKIRIDLGIPIDMGPVMKLYPRSSQEKGGKYCAIGRIRYTCVDRGEAVQDGHLLYIKPTFYKSEPRDIYNYGTANGEFPHESTADQWFSESQFESYRMLGSHVIDEICAGAPIPATIEDSKARQRAAANWSAPDIETFFQTAERYLDDEVVRETRPIRSRVFYDATKVQLHIDHDEVLSARFL
ncbi:MAG TPA: patatin-like phospholipase family protein [Thermoanaerobaculia bacterium]|nr:patatin-like phospholipase family protein [Thermoanaerobaculia bacterium]